MTIKLNRTIARSTKGWIGGDHLTVCKMYDLLKDADVQGFFSIRKTFIPISQ